MVIFTHGRTNINPLLVNQRDVFTFSFAFERISTGCGGVSSLMARGCNVFFFGAVLIQLDFEELSVLINLMYNKAL